MNNRAKQFMPFDALKGFRQAIKEKERIISPKIELSEDDLEVLSYKMKQVKKNTIVKIVYFCKDEYVVLQGMVSDINFDYRYLKIIKNKINFADIVDVKADYIKDFPVD